MGDGTTRLGLMEGDRVTLDSYAIISATAQNILDVRAHYLDWPFAELYNEDTMGRARAQR